jgi:hypothetical protein
MSYTLQVAWSGKDALADSDPEKVVSGSDFDTEFGGIRDEMNNNLAAKAGNSSQNFATNDLSSSGITTLATATATTPAAGDNDTSVATTAYVQTEIGLLGTNGNGDRTIEAVGSNTTPTGGSNGDIIYRY